MRHKVIWLRLVLLSLALMPSSTLAQGFPWRDFERRTMPDLLKINEQEEAENIKRFPDQTQFVFRGARLPSLVSLTYTGESRVLSSDRKKFIELWATSYYQNPGYANLYTAEFLLGTVMKIIGCRHRKMWRSILPRS